jgi:hypothetical protein
LADLLAFKAAIDKHQEETNHMDSGSYTEWMVAAMELLLKVALKEAREGEVNPHG